MEYRYSFEGVHRIAFDLFDVWISHPFEIDERDRYLIYQKAISYVHPLLQRRVVFAFRRRTVYRTFWI